MIGADAAPALAFLGECFIRFLTRRAWSYAAVQDRRDGPPRAAPENLAYSSPASHDTVLHYIGAPCNTRTFWTLWPAQSSAIFSSMSFMNLMCDHSAAVGHLHLASASNQPHAAASAHGRVAIPDP
jgi:hypothetical protein